MIAFKGFTKDLAAVMGRGTYQFKIGETVEEETSKTVQSGFHCCENPFECLTYYPMNGENRFFKVEAAGDIDEDATARIACTKITLLEELTPLQLAVEGMRYMIEHPDREKWEQRHGTVTVKKDEAEAKAEGHIAIARGADPKVKGPKGSILGLLVENEEGMANCKLFIQGETFADKWCRITENRTVEEVLT